MSYLFIDGITKVFEDKTILDRIDIRIPKGEISCILGPSGCGKTTLLRIIAGLEAPDEGSVFLNGKNLTSVPAHRRQFGLMFQDYALFPHKNVSENIAFGLVMKKEPKRSVREKTGEMLSMVGLEGFENRGVDSLSGGERQRVALARSLAPNPRLLLLDEPFASLDPMLRKKLSSDLFAIIKNIGITTMFVTHDHLEAFSLGDTVSVMQDGRIGQTGTPENLYRYPKNVHLAKFLGFKNLLPAKIVNHERIACEMGTLFLSPPLGIKIKDPVLLFRPEIARILSSVRIAQENEITIFGRVRHRIFQGHHYFLVMSTNNNTELTWHLPTHPSPPHVGEVIGLSIEKKDIIYLSP